MRSAGRRPSRGWTARCANSGCAGVATNIEFVINLLKHPTFLDDTYTTKFIDTTPDLFAVPRKRRDRATKILTYIADISVNGHPRPPPAGRCPGRGTKPPPPGAEGRPRPRHPATCLEERAPRPSPTGCWQKRLLITDTTMRDGHQSLLATRMRSIDMIRSPPSYAANLPQLFSVECWGGATFDVAYRFPAGMPVAAAARHPRPHAQPDDADAAARQQRRRLHQLSRQRRCRPLSNRPPRPASTCSASSTV